VACGATQSANEDIRCHIGIRTGAFWMQTSLVTWTNLLGLTAVLRSLLSCRLWQLPLVCQSAQSSVGWVPRPLSHNGPVKVLQT
jgi:hypothetical protein